MKNCSFLLLFFIVNLFNPCTAGERQLNVQEARELLTRALDYSMNTPFYAEKRFVNADGTRKISKSYYNGKLFLKNAQAGRRKVPYWILTDYRSNQEYEWFKMKGKSKKRIVFHQDTITNGNFPWVCVRGMLEEQRLKAGKYILSDSIFMGKPCWKLIVRYPDTESSIVSAPVSHFYWHSFLVAFPEAKQLDRYRLTLKDYREKKDRLRKAYYCAFEVYIDKEPDSPFIYDALGFTLSGTPMRFSPKFDKIVFTDRFPASCKFKYPSGATVVEIENYADYCNKKYDEYSIAYLNQKNPGDKFRDNLSSWIAKINSLFANSWRWIVNFFFDYGVIILRILGLITLTAAIVFKIYRRRNK